MIDYTELYRFGQPTSDSEYKPIIFLSAHSSHFHWATDMPITIKNTHIWIHTHTHIQPHCGGGTLWLSENEGQWQELGEERGMEQRA